MGCLPRISRFAAPALCLWACATSEDPDPAPRGQGGRGGGLGTGGRLLTGGSGGALPRGGSAAGSGGPSVSGGATTIAGGAGGIGGVGTGTGGIPESVLARASVVLHYAPDLSSAVTSRIFMRLFLENRAPDPLPLADVSVRYWMSSEVGAPTLQSFYQGANLVGQSQVFVDDPEPHVVIRFEGKTIPRGTDLSANEFQLQIAGGSYDQSDDYSWDPAFTAGPRPHAKITVYLAEHLIWGCEPSGNCAGANGAGGAGGTAGGSSGAAGAGETAGAAGHDGAGGTAGATGAGGEGG